MGMASLASGLNTRKKFRLKEVGKTIAATLLVLAIVEVFLRVVYFVRNSMVDYVVLPYNAAQDFGPVPPWIDGLRILERDEALFWRNRHNVRRSYMDVYSPVEREEDRTALLRQFLPVIPKSLRGNPVWSVSLNSQGFREVEFSTEKPSSVFRIICLGDSWTFGANVDQEDAYPQRLGALLRREFPEADFEVFNLGVLGYSSYQGLELLRRKVLDIEPDLVVIGFGMNDASVAGYRDKDMALYDKRSNAVVKKARHVLGEIELYKILRYAAEIVRRKPWSIGDYMQTIAASAGTPAEAWIGGQGNESADYEKLEPYTRVSLNDYETNIVEMIDLARAHRAGIILLYNQLWDTPYRRVLETISRAKEVPLVDSKVLIDRARTEIEQNLEEGLGLRPPKASQADGSEETEVIFRVYAGKHAVPTAIYIAGVHPNLGGGVPNKLAMYDDGTHGDQRAGDDVWSYAATFAPGTRLFYVYTNSGETGRWESVDIPEIRRFTVKAAAPGEKLYRPIESFGKMYMQADGWHTNAAGYELIAKTLLENLKKHDSLRRYLEQTAAKQDEQLGKEVEARRTPPRPSTPSLGFGR
jgi:lysophospholipase L1-like esterase